MEERGYGRTIMRTRSGFKLSVSFDRKKDGKWKIGSVGAAEGITALLPFEVSRLVYLDPFDTLDDAKWAVKSV